MIDPNLNQLYKIVYQERLQAAMESRQRATWVTASNLVTRTQMAIGRSLVAWGERLQTPAARTYSTR